MRTLIALALAALIFGAASSWGQQMDAAPTFTEADAGAVRELKVGAQAVLALAANPTTGYRWTIASTDADIVAINESGHAPATAAIGSPGTTKWLIQAKKPGATQLRLKYWRSWEGEASVVQRFEMTLRVAP